MTKEEAKKEISELSGIYLNNPHSSFENYVKSIMSIIDSIDSPVNVKPEPSRLEIAAMCSKRFMCQRRLVRKNYE